MKRKNKKILVADSDPQLLKQLCDALKASGMDVLKAKDGPRTLELAVQHNPDIILMEITLPYLNAIKVAQILKSNPNLREVPIIFSSSGKINPDYVSFLQNAVINKPFNVDEVIMKITTSLLKMEKAREVEVEVKEVEGNLAQMSLVDILQIFSMNKKDGVIVVRQEEEGKEAMIFLKEGQIINASIDAAKGEKALYRILGWDSGKFEYIPRDFHPEFNIEKSTDSLLMEGMRQLDEGKKMAGDFPPMDSLLYLKVDRNRLTTGLRPLTQEVLSLLEFYRRVEDIVNNSDHPDFEVMMTIHTLVSKGIVEVKEKEKKKEKGTEPLLTPEEAFAIKEYFKSPLKERYEMDVVKIPLFARGLEEVKSVTNHLTNIEGFTLSKEFISGAKNGIAFGTVGRIKASENITLMFTALPMGDIYAPLWGPLMSHSIGAVILRGKDDDGLVSAMIEQLRESVRIKSAVVNLEEGLPEIDNDVYQMNVSEIKDKEAGRAFHELLDSMLELP